MCLLQHSLIPRPRRSLSHTTLYNVAEVEEDPGNETLRRHQWPVLSSEHAAKCLHCTDGFAHWCGWLTDAHNHPQRKAAHNKTIQIPSTCGIETAVWGGNTVTIKISSFYLCDFSSFLHCTYLFCKWQVLAWWGLAPSLASAFMSCGKG